MSKSKHSKWVNSRHVTNARFALRDLNFLVGCIIADLNAIDEYGQMIQRNQEDCQDNYHVDIGSLVTVYVDAWERHFIPIKELNNKLLSYDEELVFADKVRAQEEKLGYLIQTARSSLDIDYFLKECSTDFEHISNPDNYYCTRNEIMRLNIKLLLQQITNCATLIDKVFNDFIQALLCFHVLDVVDKQ